MSRSEEETGPSTRLPSPPGAPAHTLRVPRVAPAFPITLPGFLPPTPALPQADQGGLCNQLGPETGPGRQTGRPSITAEAGNDLLLGPWGEAGVEAGDGPELPVARACLARGPRVQSLVLPLAYPPLTAQSCQLPPCSPGATRALVGGQGDTGQGDVGGGTPGRGVPDP